MLDAKDINALDLADTNLQSVSKSIEVRHCKSTELRTALSIVHKGIIIATYESEDQFDIAFTRYCAKIFLETLLHNLSTQTLECELSRRKQP